ncbi:TAXI family TRAP transporter solute-binding subunit [Domibacillus epiphyticus]|uniref:TAXI family TRAP transporter solute-binding subunit n=1 Tax=Domibacillus epiphyticus TaxID=1714355 RepID=UPI001185C51C|nr:TAXI family TRAP transporter solute-binding subunit [Domibacillus epiphyticus]
MKKQFLFVVMFISTLSLLLSACGPNGNQNSIKSSAQTSNSSGEIGKQTSVRIGTSSSGSPFYTVGVGLSNIISKHDPGYNMTVEPVGGSHPNVFALATDRVDFAITNSLAAEDGFKGITPFESKVDIRLVAQGQASVRQLIVRKDSGIDSPSNLKGKTIIGKRPAMPEIEQIMDAVLDEYGVAKEDVKIISTTDSPEVIEALELGTVDGAFFPASLNAATLSELLSDEEFKLISFEEEKVDSILEKLPKAVHKFVIPGGTYSNQKKDVTAFALNTYLVAKRELEDDAVYRLTKTMFNNYDEFSALHSSAKDWTVEHSLTDPVIPFHAGAIKYYQEIKAWHPEMDVIQQTLETQ